MAKTVKNWNELQRAIEGRIQLSLKQTRDIVAKCIQESLNDYYKEKVFKEGTTNIPAAYQRTYALLNSMVATEITKKGNQFYCEVKINEDYLNHVYDKETGINGLDVLVTNEEEGWHGTSDFAVIGEHHIWTEAMNNITAKGGVLSILKEKLKKNGLNIR